MSNPVIDCSSAAPSVGDGMRIYAYGIANKERRLFIMDFLDELFDFGDRKRRNKDQSFQKEHYHTDDDDHNHQHQHQYPTDSYTQTPTNTLAFLPGVVCRNCSTQTVQGAKFCLTCGVLIQAIFNCAACGSKLTANAQFCPQCGYKNG